MAATRYGVACAKHGMTDTKRGYKISFVPRPSTKKQRKDGGCPSCKKEGYTSSWLEKI
jgi:hypothetical protein